MREIDDDQRELASQIGPFATIISTIYVWRVRLFVAQVCDLGAALVGLKEAGYRTRQLKMVEELAFAPSDPRPRLCGMIEHGKMEETSTRSVMDSTLVFGTNSRGSNPCGCIFSSKQHMPKPSGSR